MADLNSLMVFAKVVEANSLSEAARRLKLPISTVSRPIADLEDQLGVRLLDARGSVDLSEAVEDIVSDHRANVSGTLRLSSPPSLSDTLLTPLIGAFQAAYPEVRVHVLVTERFVDPIAEGGDLVFRIGTLKDSTLVARRLLTYRHQLVASPAYLERCPPPQRPADLLGHRLLAFSRWTPENHWHLAHAESKTRATLTFEPYLAINDYAGLAAALVAGTGIGDLPPLVQPDLLRDGRLVEVMPSWRVRTGDLSVVCLRNRYIPRPVRVLQEFAARMGPTLFPDLSA